MKYHNRLGYDLADGERVRLEQNFKINHDPILSVGDLGTVKVLHADYGKVWGIEFDAVGWVVSGEREGYGEAFLIENVSPLSIDEQYEQALISAESVRDMLRNTLGVADVFTPTALPSAEASGMTWQDFENAMTPLEVAPAKLGRIKWESYTTDFYHDDKGRW